MPTFSVFIHGSRGKLYKVATSTSINGLYRIVYTLDKIKNPFQRFLWWIQQKKPEWREVHKSYVYVSADYLCTCSARELEDWMRGAIIEYEESQDFIRKLG